MILGGRFYDKKGHEEIKHDKRLHEKESFKNTMKTCNSEKTKLLKKKTMKKQRKNKAIKK